MPFIKVNDCSLYYETEGAGTPVIFLHGLGSSLKDWEFQREFLSKRYQVIFVDMRGHGRSDRPQGGYSISVLKNDILKFLDQLQIPAAHFIGISMGGMVALELAATEPRRSLSLTVINSFWELKPKSLSQWHKIMSRFLAIYFLGIDNFGKLLAKNLFPKIEQHYLRRSFIERFQENDKNIYLKLFWSMIGWGVRESLGKISSPALIISGDRDYTPLSYKEECAALMPDALALLIEDSGHGTPADQPKKLNDLILSFLVGLESRVGGSLDVAPKVP